MVILMCPNCKSSRVNYVETYDDGSVVDNYYECLYCENTFDKYELITEITTETQLNTVEENKTK